MRIVALVKGPDHVCCRYRVAAYRSFWLQAGHSLEIHPWPRSVFSRLSLHRQLGRVDVLILQRKSPGPRQVALLRRQAGCLVYDFDDALFLRDSYAPQGLFCARRAAAFRQIVRDVDVVVAGNGFLRDEAALWTDAAKIQLIPTCVDVLKYPLSRYCRATDAVKLVWIGSASTLKGLELIRTTLENLGQQNSALELKIICNEFLRLRSLKVDCCQWSEATEAQELGAADIGISWLPDDLWSLGKCGLKILQYMAAGLPVVGNAVGVQSDLIRDGETGFLVRTPQEFASAVRRLAENPDLRRRMGRAGRQRVCREFNTTVGAWRWLRLLDGVATRRMRQALTVS